MLAQKQLILSEGTSRVTNRCPLRAPAHTGTLTTLGRKMPATSGHVRRPQQECIKLSIFPRERLMDPAADSGTRVSSHATRCFPTMWLLPVTPGPLSRTFRTASHLPPTSQSPHLCQALGKVFIGFLVGLTFESAPGSSGSPIKTQITGHTDSGGLGNGLGICISDEFPICCCVLPA